MEGKDKLVNIRKWDSETDTVRVIQISLSDVIKDPFYLNLEDIGFELINIEREKLGLAKLIRQQIIQDENLSKNG